MIAERFINEWAEFVPWTYREYIEQDLLISRALCELYKDDFISEHLAFRGGTALNKIYLSPQPRYSEDIDLVQIKVEPIKETIIRIRKILAFIGKPAIKQKLHNNTLVFKFMSETPPIIPMSLKIEINTREHFSTLGLIKKELYVKNSWFSGNCNLTTYQLEELLGTKLRALYQRKKGRDLFDLWKVLSTHKLDTENIMKSYYEYMNFSVKTLPSKKQYLQNIELKLEDSEFIGDTAMLLRPDTHYNPVKAWNLVKKTLIENL